MGGIYAAVLVRKRADQEIRKSQERLTNFMDSASDSFYLLDSELNFVDINARGLRLIGKPKSEIVGKNLSEIVPDVMSSGRYAKHQRVLRTGKPFTIDHFVPHPVFGNRHFILQSFKIGDGLGVIAADITERKKAEEALRSSEERFRLAFENARDAIFWANPKTGEILNCNHAAEQLLERSKSEIMGMNQVDLHPPEGEDYYRTGFKRHAGKENEGIMEAEVLTKSGKRVPVSITSSLTVFGKQPVFQGIFRDISEQKETEEAERRHREQLLQADKMASLGMTVSGVAHEINNPNNLIMLNADVLKAFWESMRPAVAEHAQRNPNASIGDLPFSKALEKFDSLLDGIGGGATRIKKIVDNLRDFARLDTGDLSDRIPVDKLIDSAVTLLANTIKRSTRVFRVEIAEELPEIQGNFQKIEQVIINLLVNACQALTSKEQAIRIHAGFCETGKGICIRIMDEGRGIPQKDLDKIMDPFFTTKRESGGTGLGLSVSFGIVKEHGGDLTFVSRKGRGTTAEIHLPPAKP